MKDLGIKRVNGEPPRLALINRRKTFHPITMKKFKNKLIGESLVDKIIREQTTATHARALANRTLSVAGMRLASPTKVVKSQPSQTIKLNDQPTTDSMPAKSVSWKTS